MIHFELTGSLFYANNLPAFIRNELIKTYNKWSWDRQNKITKMIILVTEKIYETCVLFHERLSN